MKMITADLVEDETNRDTKGRRMRPKARREELVAAHEKSGRTQVVFARREGIKYCKRPPGELRKLVREDATATAALYSSNADKQKWCHPSGLDQAYDQQTAESLLLAAEIIEAHT